MHWSLASETTESTHEEVPIACERCHNTSLVVEIFIEVQMNQASNRETVGTWQILQLEGNNWQLISNHTVVLLAMNTITSTIEKARWVTAES